ncbi:gibberellin 20-oxidase [Phlyctema vagabunda]|uniref:Gibberellin 20-oxidase n=1 Tax=Phlyctema vagabunda TaxID=108571 RepID=A0ABR4PU36_9HELO
MILSRLSSQLSLTGAARFESDHVEPGPSLSTLVLLHYLKHDESTALTNVGHLKHTDVSNLTFLLVEQWGLQFLNPQSQQWEFLEPRPGHAIVNVGDFLRFKSGGELASIVHRVIPLREKQDEDRYSIAYFFRMNDDTRFTDPTGKSWTAKEWHDFKFDVFRSPSTLDSQGQFLTGMMEKNDRMVAREGITQ